MAAPEPESSRPLFTAQIFGVRACETESVLVTPACFRSLAAARISRFPPQLALSKKNTLDEFQAQV